MVGSLGGSGGPPFGSTRKTASGKKDSSSKADQNSLDNSAILTNPKTGLPVGKRREDQTGNSPSKDDLRGKSREKHAEEKHLSRIKHKINIPTTPPTSPRTKLNTQVTTAPKKDNLRQSSTNLQKTGPETKPSPLMNKSILELLPPLQQSPIRKAATVTGGGAAPPAPESPVPTQTQTPASAQTPAPASDVTAAQLSGNQDGGGVAPASASDVTAAQLSGNQDGGGVAPAPPPAGRAEAAPAGRAEAAPAGGAAAEAEKSVQEVLGKMVEDAAVATPTAADVPPPAPDIPAVQPNNPAGGGAATDAPSQLQQPQQLAIESFMVSGGNFGDLGGAAQTQTPAAANNLGAGAATPAAPAGADGTGGATPAAPAPAAENKNKALEIKYKNSGKPPEINNWLDARTDDRDKLGDHIFSVEGEISIVFSKVTNVNGVESVGTEMNSEGELQAYGANPKTVIDDVFQQSTWLYNNIEDEVREKNKVHKEDEVHKFNKKIEATINKVLNTKSFNEALQNKGVPSEVKNILNIKKLKSQEKLVVLFAAIEVLHNTGTIKKEDILLLQEIKVVFDAFNTIDSEIMGELEKDIYSNEGANEKPFQDFINHALFLHQKKIQNINDYVQIGCLKVSNITCQVRSFAGVSDSYENITSPSIGGATPFNSPHVAVEAPTVDGYQNELTKQLQEHLTKLKEEFEKHYESRSIGTEGQPEHPVREAFRKIVEEFKESTVIQFMGSQKDTLYNLLNKLKNWKDKGCDKDDIAGNLNKLHEQIRSDFSPEPMSKENLGQLINDLHDTAENLKSVEQSQD